MLKILRNSYILDVNLFRIFSKIIGTNYFKIGTIGIIETNYFKIKSLYLTLGKFPFFLVVLLMPKKLKEGI